jgi:hypothetical protein
VPDIIDNADSGEMVRDREKLSSVLDSAPQTSINLANVFKNVFNNSKNAGLCYPFFALFTYLPSSQARGTGH